MEILILLMNFIVLFWLFLYTSLTYKELPKKIPIHFGITGKADRQARKRFYWLIPVIGLLIFMLMTYTNDNLKNLTLRDLRLTSNWKNELKNSIPLLINILILICFIDVQSSIYKVATQKAEKLNKSVWIWFAVIIVVSILLSIFLKT